MSEKTDSRNLNFLAKLMVDPKSLGIKIGSIGVLATIAGSGLLILGLESLGIAINYIGIAIVFMGMLLHIIMMFRK